MSLTAVSVSDNNNEAICQHFVRCQEFLLIDNQSQTQKKVSNPYHISTEDAGIKAVQFLKALGVQKLIAGDFGAHVQEEARKQNIQLIIVDTKKMNINTLTHRK